MKHTRTHTIFHKQIGINVGIIREEKGLSQTDLALRTGIDRSYINRLENARANWSVDHLITVADGLDVPITKLFDGLDQCPPRDVDPFDYAISGIATRESADQ